METDDDDGFAIPSVIINWTRAAVDCVAQGSEGPSWYFDVHAYVGRRNS